MRIFVCLAWREVTARCRNMSRFFCKRNQTEQKKKTQKSVYKSDSSCIALSWGSRSSVDSANRGTDQVTVSMSSCVFTAPAQRTYQRVIEWMERKKPISARRRLTLCSFLFLSAAQSPMLCSKFLPVPERPCQEWKKGWFSELTDKKGDVITQSEMLLYSLMELEFELPVFAHVGDASQPWAALARLFISADNGRLSWPRASPRRACVRLLRWRRSGRLANPTPAPSTCRGSAPSQQSCFFAAQVTQG